MKFSQRFRDTEVGKIPIDWKIKKLGCFGDFRNGVNFSREDFGRGYPVINVKNLFSGRYATTKNLAEIKEGTIKNINLYSLQKGDILFARSSVKASGAGQVAMINDLPNNITLFSGFIIRFRNNSSKLLSDNFINYLLRSNIYRKYLTKIAIGTSIINLTQGTLSNIPVILPPLNEQNWIVNILTDLDSKIELNNQINKNLEEITQEIFKQWFIDFEFPDENGEPYKSSGGEMLDSEIGQIPKGWEIKKVGEILKTVLGGTPSRKKKIYWENGKIPWVNSGKVNEYRIIEPSEYITELGLRKSSTKLLPKRTTVIAITGATLGKISLLEIDCCANQSIVGILENNIFKSEYIYFWMINIIDSLISWQTGGAQQHINKDNINKFGILAPSEKILLKYYKQTKPIFNKISNNCIESKNLQNLRDTLLPKLMSGEIRIV
jgi:type I restriction enzyme S subunit